MSLERAIKQRAAELGFHLAGITSAEPFEDARTRMLAWLERGYQAEMAWLNPERAERECHPEQLLPGARSIICVAVSYLSGVEIRESRVKSPGPDYPLSTLNSGLHSAPGSQHSALKGRVARYAQGDDYHEVLRERLWQLVDFLGKQLGSPPRVRVFVDSSPFPDREAAVRAGLGFYGKNTCLLTGPLGSFLFLGAIVTDVELRPDEEVRSSKFEVRDGDTAPRTSNIEHRTRIKDCGRCRLCIDACPTGALVEPYELDAGRCISYLTIELRGSIPVELRPALGDHIFGCDVCQDVCPWNRRVVPMAWPEFAPRPRLGANPELGPLLELDEPAFRERFRRSPIRRAKRSGLLRNVAVALGNSGDLRAVPPLRQALQDPDALVRAHTAWALGQLRGNEARRALEEALATETQPEVRAELEAALLQVGDQDLP